MNQASGTMQHRLASIQMVSSENVEDNLKQAAKLIAEASARGATVAVLPEYFCLMGMRDSDKLTIAEPDGEGPLQNFLSEQAAKHKLFLIGGTLPIQTEQANKVFNALLVYGSEGDRIARYDKIHLFKYQTDKEAYDEGRVLEAGTVPVVANCGGIRVGLSVCYDLRFPELYRAMLPIDVLVVPAAFTYGTGKAHWQMLLQARAVENQCYVIGTGQGGKHTNGRSTWGHSMIIDPWGEVLDVLPEGPGVVIAELCTDKMSNIREKLPALTHRVIKHLN